MRSKFIFAWCLSYLCFEICAEHLLQYSEESSNNNQCIFNVSQKIYNVTDLLRCMDELAIDFLAQNSDRSLKQTSQSNSLAYRENSYEFPYGNIISNLFNNGKLPSIQDFPLGSIVNNDQLNYPNILNEPFAQFGGLGVNLLSAVSLISRNDDLKCVSRILCEVASGKPPGEYKQASNNMQYLREFGINVFTQWLTRLPVTSPVLSFARAAVLGYSSNGNPAMCYRAFPRCPRNPDKLVHYLNNHKGGFFQFFNRGGHGSYLQSSYASQDNSEFLRGRKWKAPPPGIAGAVADRTGTGKLKFDISVLTTHRDYEKSFFPKENTPESSGQMVFPDYEDSNDYPSENKILKSLSDLQDSDVNIFSQDSSSFFPQESEDQSDRVLRFTPELPDLSPRNTFRFPH